MFERHHQGDGIVRPCICVYPVFRHDLVYAASPSKPQGYLEFNSKSDHDQPVWLFQADL